MNIYKTLKKRFLKAVATAVQNFIPEFSQIAELLTGGMVIFSEQEQNGDRKIFAQTVLQLDGDIITAFHEDTVRDADFEKLSQQHFKEVTFALAPLGNLSTWIKRITKYGPYVGLIFQGLTGYWSIDQKGLLKIFLHIGTISSIPFTLICLYARGSFMCIVRWWVRWQIKEEYDEYRKKNLSEFQEALQP